MASSVVFLLGASTELGWEAGKEALLRFCHTAVCQQLGQHAEQLQVGVCGLVQGATRQQVQVKLRPSPIVLRDVHAAVSKLARSEQALASSQVPAALAQLVAVLAKEAACTGGVRLVLLTDQVELEPGDFQQMLEVSKDAKVTLSLVLMCCGEPGSVDDSLAASADGWAALEARYPLLSVTFAESAHQLGYGTLASAILQQQQQQQRSAGAPGAAAPVILQFKLPLVGEVRSLPLKPHRMLRLMDTATEHCTLCCCHGAPCTSGAGALCCAVSGAALAQQQCTKDACLVQVGSHPGGVLRFDAPFSFGSGSDQATLTVMQRVKRAWINPALLVGPPVALLPESGGVKVAQDGQLHDVSTAQLLHLLVQLLRRADEALLASSSSADLGARGSPATMFRHHYLLQPGAATGGSSTSSQAVLWASRLAAAEEVVQPCLPASPAMSDAPPVIREAVLSQLSKLALAEVDLGRLSSRCHETLSVLVRASKSLPQTKPIATPAAAVAVPPAQMSRPAAWDNNAAEAEGVAKAAAAKGWSQKAHAEAGAPAAKPSAGACRGAKGRGQANTKTGLQLKRVQR